VHGSLLLSMSPKVLILSKEEDLSRALADSLLAKDCDVLIHSSFEKVRQHFDYIVVINFNDKFGNEKFEKSFSNGSPKIVIVNSIENRQSINGVPVAIKQIFVDQIYPFNVEVLRSLFAKADGVVYIPKEAWLNITTVQELVEKIEEELFSFPQEKKYIFGKLVSYREAVLAKDPTANIYINANFPSRLPRSDLAIVETETKVGLLNLLPEKNEKSKRQRVSLPRRTMAFVALFCLVLLSPYLLLFLAGLGSFTSYKLLQSGDVKRAGSILSFSNKLASASKNLFLFGRILPFGEKAVLLSKSTQIGGQVLAMTDYSFGFSNGIFEGGDLEALSRELSLDLEALYRDLSFLEGELDIGKVPFFDKFSEFTIAEYRSYVLTASKIARSLPSLLGYDSPKTYMVLLQNNMELRPTGGFIGSFALLTFSKGKLIDDTIYDVYSADGQLKGYVKPPAPIEEHLGEASWTLRDSNWDPDFLKSAESAKWFLDKTLDRKVDGVIGVNLEVAQKYLQVLGPVFLADFEDTINSDNMYEKVQYEVEESFFPGSRKKAQYLSSLSEALIGRIKAGSIEELVKLLYATVLSLNSRDLQVYFSDQKLQETFADAGWTGEINYEDCQVENCAYVFSGIVEANLGVNKANYFVKREVKAKVALTDSFIEQEVSLYLKNTAANRDRVPEQRYKTYVRAIAPRDSEIISTKLYGSGLTQDLGTDVSELPGRVEYGVLVDILPGEEKIVTFKWRTPAELELGKIGKLKFSWWKQSGSGEYPFYLEYVLPSLSGIKTSPPLRLTEGGSFLYNTTLSEDLESTLSWDNK